MNKHCIAQFINGGKYWQIWRVASNPSLFSLSLSLDAHRWYFARQTSDASTFSPTNKLHYSYGKHENTIFNYSQKFYLSKITTYTLSIILNST